MNLMHLKRILLILILFSFIPSSYADPPLPTPVGRVVWIKGTFKAIMPNQEQRILQKTSVIYLNDTLVTESASQAQIVFTDNSLMTFRPETKFYVDKYEYHAKTKDGSVGTYIMNLVEGGFRTITGVIAKTKPTDYQVNTPVATIGVQGTDYAVYVHAGELSMAYYTGSPCVSNAGGSICLSKAIPFASVPAIGVPPIPVKIQPAVFKEKQEVVPAKIAPFTGGAGNDGSANGGGAVESPGSGTAGSAGGSGATKSGTTTGFCIQ